MFQLVCTIKYKINIQHKAVQYICAYMQVQGLCAGHYARV